MLGEVPEPAERSRAQWLLMAGGSLAGTALTLGLALLLGNIGFEYRRAGFHEKRLERLLERAPRLEQVLEGLESEGTRLVESAEDEVALARLAHGWGGARRAEVVEKGKRWASTRAFLAEDYVYILYFDATRLLQDFTCVRR